MGLNGEIPYKQGVPSFSSIIYERVVPYLLTFFNFIEESIMYTNYYLDSNGNIVFYTK